MEMRSELGNDKLDEIQKAYLERTGKISFQKYPSKAKIMEVKIEDGVQLVKIKIE